MSGTEQGETGRDELSRLLRTLRKSAQLSGIEAGRAAGISQAKVSRFEHGLYVPSLDEIKTLARIYRAPADMRQRLVAIVEDLQEATTPSRVVLHRGAARFQQRIGRIENASEHVRTFTPTVVPGLLQSRQYARAIFVAGEHLGSPVTDVEAAVEARLARQELLVESDRRFTLLMTEGALRWQAGSALVMLEQLEHIGKQLERLQVGVIPWTTPVHVFPLHGFDLYDSRAVIVGIETATALLTERSDVEAYVRLFTELEGLAAFGDEAHMVLDRLSAAYRGLI